MALGVGGGGRPRQFSTFRTAAELCEEFEGFVFNHNEALLYRWVEEYEPALFERIRILVAKGRWHVHGRLVSPARLPICPRGNPSSGRYWKDGATSGRNSGWSRARPSTSIPSAIRAGSSRSLAKAGYDSYVVCRPSSTELTLPADDLTWVGFDGSTVVAHRASEHYLSFLGKARDKLELWLAKRSAAGTEGPGMMLWGIGDHGGGPSRVDLEALRDFFSSRPELELRHSRPEDFFGALAASGGRVAARRVLPSIPSQ